MQNVKVIYTMLKAHISFRSSARFLDLKLNQSTGT